MSETDAILSYNAKAGLLKNVQNHLSRLLVSQEISKQAEAEVVPSSRSVKVKFS